MIDIDAARTPLPRRASGAPAGDTPARRAPSYASLDDALETVSGSGPDLANGMTTHAPMAVEALCALGRPDAAPAWMARYRELTRPWPSRRERIAPDGWRAALARMDRVADWRELFAAELRCAPWEVVLERWVARLTPGICANAAHGVIRVGHAVRALSNAETPPRLRELGDALATWAATYQELPTATGTGTPAQSARAAIERVAIVPTEQRRFAGTIVSSLVALNEFPDFAPVIGLLDVSGDPARLLPELTEVFTRVYLANAHDFLRTIVLIHGVTSLAALAHALPYLHADTAREALRFAWQSSCGLYATFGSEPAVAGPVETPGEDPDTLADLAVAHGDEHAIKFTEACLSQHAANPSPVYLAAARHALEMLPRA